MYYRYCPTVKSLLNVPLNHKSHLRFLSDAKCPFEIQNLLNVKTFLSPTEKILGQKRKDIELRNSVRFAEREVAER